MKVVVVWLPHLIVQQTLLDSKLLVKRIQVSTYSSTITWLLDLKT